MSNLSILILQCTCLDENVTKGPFSYICNQFFHKLPRLKQDHYENKHKNCQKANLVHSLRARN